MTKKAKVAKKQQWVTRDFQINVNIHQKTKRRQWTTRMLGVIFVSRCPRNLGQKLHYVWCVSKLSIRVRKRMKILVVDMSQHFEKKMDNLYFSIIYTTKMCKNATGPKSILSCFKTWRATSDYNTSTKTEMCSLQE